MFDIGDKLIYGNNGVCTVTSIGPLDAQSSSGNVIYYTLEPYYTTGSKFYTPVDNDKDVMRSVISKKDAQSLIDNIDDIECLDIPDERHREEIYKETVRKCDCVELIKLIKTIYFRKQSRQAEGKKVTASDEKYFKIAENSLYGELGCVLDMTKDQVKDYIISK